MQEQPPHGFGPRSNLLTLGAIGAYLLYALGVQGMQGASRGIEVFHLAAAGTVLAVRFQLVALLAGLAGLRVARRDRSWEVFKPGNVKLRLAQGAAQALQTVFIVLAAAELAGKFQAAVSLALVGLWTNAIGTALHRRDKHAAVSGRAWVYPVMYVAVAVFIATQSGASQGNLWLGLAFMAASGLCTSAMHSFTEEAADESKITSTLWQNGPAAVLSIALWFLPAPMIGQASLPSEHLVLTVVLLLTVALCSMGQQLALQLAAWLGKQVGMGTNRLVPLRGAQVYFGALIDWLAFSNPPHGAAQWAAMAMVLLPMALGWIWTRPKPQQA